MGKIIAVCNQKGGTGKTTSAVSICAYLALAKRRVLLVDIDPQGNATSGLGVDKGRLAQSIYNVLLGEMGIAEIVLSDRVVRLQMQSTLIVLDRLVVPVLGLQHVAQVRMGGRVIRLVLQ